MFSVWFVRKDDPKVRKFDGHYPTEIHAENRKQDVVTRGLISYNWKVIIKPKG
jgi:hypothetical protein